MRLLPLLLLPMRLLATDPCVVVEGDRFTAGELAKVVPAFLSAPADALLGYSPAPGIQRTLRQTELELFARSFGFQVDSPASVCIVRFATVLTPDEVKREIAAVLEGTNARFELIDFSKAPVPKGRLEFPRTGLTRPRAGEPAVWKGRIVYSGSKSVSVWAKVRVSVPTFAVLAARDLLPGKPIESSDLKLEAMESHPFEPRGLTRIEDVLGLTLRRPLRAGDRIVAAGLIASSEIARGDRVEVTAQTGGARLSFTALAETGGSKGARVLLKNPENGKRFAAVVERKGKAIVLGGGGDSGK